MTCVIMHWIAFMVLQPIAATFLWSETTSNDADMSLYHNLGKILHYKRLFTEQQKSHLQEFKSALFGGHWKYYDYDNTPADGIPWQLPLDSLLLAKSPLWKLIQTILPLSDKGKSAHVDSVVKVLRRGDSVQLTRVCRGAESGYTLLLFLTKLHNSNDYGEILFFQDGDVHTTIQPVQHSLLAWSCNIPYQIQYPSISTGFGQVMLQITLYDTVDRPPVYFSHTVKPFPLLLLPHNSSTQPLKVGELVLKTVHTSRDRPIHVLDDLFSADMLSALREHIYQYSHYYYDDSDDVDQSGSDNVQWISGYRTHEFVQSDMWPIVLDTVTHITGHAGWYPYDVSCNLNRAWDHTRIHVDCYDKDEFTFMVYLNPELKPGDLAGTVWYEHEDHNTIVTSVQNKYGRVALFHCDTQHAARPPHAFLKHARYTFVVKVARSKLDAVRREMANVVARLNGSEDNEEETDQWIRNYMDQIHHNATLLENKFVELQDQLTHLLQQELADQLESAGA